MLPASTHTAGDADRVICIGDLHGNVDEAAVLWARLGQRLGAAALRRATVVFLGDYCDRGPATRAVLDLLIAIRDERAAAAPDAGATHFLAGNHDLGFAAYLGCLPISGAPPLDLDATRDPAFTTGFYAHAVAGGMHYAGRRWGGSAAYSAAATFRSYGIDMQYTPECRAALLAAVPQAHRDFLAALTWVADCRVPWAPGRVLCAHAGFASAGDVEAQVAALKGRDLGAAVLFEEGDPSRVAALHGRGAVIGMPPALEGKAVVVSGHHGCSRRRGDRFVIDASGGRPTDGEPLQALVLPQRVIVVSGAGGA
jgi:hypothetical protein